MPAEDQSQVKPRINRGPVEKIRKKEKIAKHSLVCHKSFTTPIIQYPRSNYSTREMVEGIEVHQERGNFKFFCRDAWFSDMQFAEREEKKKRIQEVVNRRLRSRTGSKQLA